MVVETLTLNSYLQVTSSVCYCNFELDAAPTKRHNTICISKISAKSLKVTVQFNFAPCMNISLYTKHWAIRRLKFSCQFSQLKFNESAYKVCSNSTTIGAGPHISTICLACLMSELWPTLCAMVWPGAACTDTSLTLDRKRSSLEVKTLHVAPQDVESLLLEVELIA